MHAVWLLKVVRTKCTSRNRLKSTQRSRIFSLHCELIDEKALSRRRDLLTDYSNLSVEGAAAVMKNVASGRTLMNDWEEAAERCLV